MLVGNLDYGYIGKCPYCHRSEKDFPDCINLKCPNNKQGEDVDGNNVSNSKMEKSS